MTKVPDDERAFAREILDVEARAVSQIQPDDDFIAAVDLISEITDDAAGGSVVVSGLGKSGLIGRKISATLASTGTPSHFLHPTEAVHGDLGRVRAKDVVLLLSFGGGTEEILSLASILRQDDVAVIAMVGNPDCELAKLATVTLAIGDLTEACPNNLAPTASTTAMLALGDALALVASRRRGFGSEDFKRFHPGGSLGRQLMPVLEAARFKVGDNLPLAKVGQSVADAFRDADTVAAGPRRTGALLIVDNDGRLAGILTDADLRRRLSEEGVEAWSLPIEQLMTSAPRHLTTEALVRDAVHLVREHRIDEIPIVDENDQPQALLDVQDLVALKVIES